MVIILLVYINLHALYIIIGNPLLTKEEGIVESLCGQHF